MEKMLTVLHDSVWLYLPSASVTGETVRKERSFLVTPRSLEIDHDASLNRSSNAYTPKTIPFHYRQINCPRETTSTPPGNAIPTRLER